MSETLPIIGISPGNSYFKDETLSYLLEDLYKRYPRLIIFIPDIPAIATYQGLGYSEKEARQRAIKKGNNIRNRVKRLCDLQTIPHDCVDFVEWKDVAARSDFQTYRQAIQTLYEDNASFREAANATTAEVLADKRGVGGDDAVALAVNYLLDELAFLDYAAGYYGAESTNYIYHKPWPVYEDYIAGKFDGKPREYQTFEVVEHPRNTFIALPSKYESAWQRIQDTKVLNASFFPYIDLFQVNDKDGFSGIFYDVISEIARRNDWHIAWKEITGYGVAPTRLEAGIFDIFCAGTWPTEYRRSAALLSQSVFDTDVFAWCRGDIHEMLETLQPEKLRIAVKKSDIHDAYADTFYPRARKSYVPQLSSAYAVLEHIYHGRAEITFGSEKLLEHFEAEIGKPSGIVKVSETPLIKTENCFLLPKGEWELKAFLDYQIQLLKADGTINTIIQSYRN